MKSGCYGFGYYGDYALKVNNELNTYELISYNYETWEIESLLISKEKAKSIFNRYNLSEYDLFEDE